MLGKFVPRARTGYKYSGMYMYKYLVVLCFVLAYDTGEEKLDFPGDSFPQSYAFGVGTIDYDQASTLC